MQGWESVSRHWATVSRYFVKPCNLATKKKILIWCLIWGEIISIMTCVHWHGTGLIEIWSVFLFFFFSLPELHHAGNIPGGEDPPDVVEVSNIHTAISSTCQSKGCQQLITLCLPIAAGARDATTTSISYKKMLELGVKRVSLSNLIIARKKKSLRNSFFVLADCLCGVHRWEDKWTLVHAVHEGESLPTRWEQQNKRYLAKSRFNIKYVILFWSCSWKHVVVWQLTWLIFPTVVGASLYCCHKLLAPTLTSPEIMIER